MNMSWKRGKTPGWASLDPNKQQKQVTDNDPYPPISTNTTPLHHHHHQNPARNVERSFSSVLLTHSTSLQNVPTTLTENSQQCIIENKFPEKLKELHPWADENLIGDVVAAVDNDFDKALSLLKQMTSPAPTPAQEENKEENTKLDDEDNVGLRLMIDRLSMIPPVEPEWEDDDDMYIIHRKDAIKAIRSACRYSKAAKEAYIRRDHASAQEFSLKAQEEWSASEKLNAKAAKEIFGIRNCENDDWKLDLHGLHASEAVQALQQHLLKIQSQHSSKPNRRLLQVITGKGSHSRGEATLPIAIKSFLSEKGYYHYEARIGVITIQPKFRQLSTA